MINEATKPVVMSLEEVKDNFGTNFNTAVKKSRFDDSLFQEACKLAIENPNQYIKFFEYSNEDLISVRKEANALKQFCRTYFDRKVMTTFKAQTILQGNKVTGFLINIKVEE